LRTVYHIYNEKIEPLVYKSIRLYYVSIYEQGSYGVTLDLLASIGYTIAETKKTIEPKDPNIANPDVDISCGAIRLLEIHKTADKIMQIIITNSIILDFLLKRASSLTQFKYG
jgi:hypothetical protein